MGAENPNHATGLKATQDSLAGAASGQTPTHLRQDLSERGGLVHDVFVRVEHVTPDDPVAGDDRRRFGGRPAQAGRDVAAPNHEAVSQLARLVRDSSR